MIYDKQFLKKTKIVATLGPATDSPEIILEMMKKGTDVFRINFSHADYADVKRKIEIIHQLNNDHIDDNSKFRCYVSKEKNECY